MKALALPLGCIDLTTEPTGDGMRCRWSDTVLGELVEVEASFEDLAEWQRIGVPPGSLVERRTVLDTAIAAAKARAEGLHLERQRIHREFPGIQFGEWN